MSYKKFPDRVVHLPVHSPYNTNVASRLDRSLDHRDVTTLTKEATSQSPDGQCTADQTPKCPEVFL